MKLKPLLPIFRLVVIALCTPALHAADPFALKPESWADQRLKVTAGLEYWLDASRAGPAQADGRLASWRDASGQKRDVKAESAEAEPTVLKVGDLAIVRFDGQNDVLRAAAAGSLERDRLTILLAAAPRRNLGGFPAVMSLNAPGRRDFETGLTLDLGPAPTSGFSSFNVEGRGFGGWQSLLQGDRPFGPLQLLEIAFESDKVSLTLNRQPIGQRPRDGKPLSLQEITLGARFYELGGGPQHVQGFGAWDIAEVLVYGRSLTTDEIGQARAYLNQKYANIKDILPPDTSSGSAVLTPVADPPAVQMLLPSFTVQELPLDLTNINNLLYRPDGSLMALAYDGTIWKLRDTNGDGLEDRAEIFWESKGGLRSPIGMDLTPPGYKLGNGVFVNEKTRCVLIVDTNHDGQADREIIVADGFADLAHQVGGLGVAFDRRDGSVYFGRGTADFTNAYLKGPDGKAKYKTTDEAGAILRVSPDFKSREIVASGIRFPVGLRFNRDGELFATDQEGATWLANGNPLDELLHIQKGRHYGFPPRHPQDQPDVIDEPSLFDYGPQHQSTCGFCFNEPLKPGGSIFGPKAWAGDALVTGESRGKLYRTRLAKTPAGYVAQTQLLACLKMLAIDCCLAPDGSLRIACHSGGPDWGSGPTGKGKIYKIKYDDTNHPQPVLAWPRGPREVRVEFDRPVPPELLSDCIKKSRLTAGPSVRAGDRFETIWPGYAVVQAQKLARRDDLPIRSAQLTPEGRTLLLATDNFKAPLHYALTLPGMGRPARESTAGKGLPQEPEIDLDFDLSGCEATWHPADGSPGWSGWLPHPDISVSQAFTKGSAPHDALWLAMQKPGTLQLHTRLNLANMLRPAVQPGSRLDHEFPPETVTVRFESSQTLQLISPSAKAPAGTSATFTVPPGGRDFVEVKLRVSSTGGSFPLSVSFRTNEDARPRPLPLARSQLPWADDKLENFKKETATPQPPELAGGRWARGRAVFYGEMANCSKCHTMAGQGGRLGPDLSNLIHRDYASVLRDITNPSFAINPDHLAYVIDLKDGRILTGVVRTEGDRVLVGNAGGTETAVARAEIERMTASPVSIMPEGLPRILGLERMRDLMTFLLSRTPAMPDYGPLAPPEPRTRAEVAAVLAGAPIPPEPIRKINVVLVAGRKDHGPGEHDYSAWQKAWGELLSIDEKIELQLADNWPTPAQLANADVLVFYQQGTWNAERARAMDGFLQRGGGAVYLHYAVDGGSDAPGFAQRIGLAWQGGHSKFRHGPLELHFDTNNKHPIARNFLTVKFHDESYWQLTGDPNRAGILAHGLEDATPQPLFWTLEPANGRVVVSIPGHYSWTFDDPLFRVLILRSIAWAAKEPVDRFNDLVLPGTNIRD